MIKFKPNKEPKFQKYEIFNGYGESIKNSLTILNNEFFLVIFIKINILYIQFFFIALN
jgi:hypothetical protein